MKKALIFAVEIGAIISFINYYENICFEMPKNWVQTLIGVVTTYGNTILKQTTQGINSWLLELEDIVSGEDKLIAYKKVSNTTNMNSKVSFEKNMVLYSKLRPYLDKVLIAKEDGIATSEIVPFYSLINSEFLILFFRSPVFLKRVSALMYGVKMPRLGTRDMQSTIIYMPPLDEQKRIVDKYHLLNNII